MEDMEFGAPKATVELVEQQLALWNARRLASRERPEQQAGFRFLTVARDQGSLGNEIAEELSRRLGWHLFDKEIVAHIAHNSHVRVNLVRQLDEKAQGLIEDMISRILRMPENASFGREEYHEALLRTLGCLAAHGSAVLLGRGANFALRDQPGGVNVRVTASNEVRLARLVKGWKTTREDARRRMHADDEERRNFIRRYYRREFDDFRFYDVLLNTDRVSVERAAASILAFMEVSG